MTLPQIFISYSHRDKQVKDHLLEHLEVFRTAVRMSTWDDHRLQYGEAWEDQLREAMESAHAAVLLISRFYLSSKTILSLEVPYLLRRNAQDGIPLFPMVISPCAWQEHDWLSRLHLFLPRDGALSELPRLHYKDAALLAFSREVLKTIANCDSSLLVSSMVRTEQNDRPHAHFSRGVSEAKRGRLTTAIDAYRAAIDESERSLKAAPHDESAAATNASAHLNLANIIRTQGRIQHAALHLEKALRTQEVLVERSPHNWEYTNSLARICNALGLLSGDEQEHESDNPEFYFRRAIALREGIPDGRPVVPRELASTLINYALWLKGRSRTQEAASALRRAIQIQMSLSAPETWPNVEDLAQLRQELGISHCNLANVLQHLARDEGDPEYKAQQFKEASEHFETATVIQESLISEFPDSPAFRCNLAVTIGNKGRLLHEQGAVQDAIQCLQLAVQSYFTVLAADPLNVHWQTFMRKDYTLLANMLLGQKKFGIVRELVRDTPPVIRDILGPALVEELEKKCAARKG